jgi:VWFA-related protein
VKRGALIVIVLFAALGIRPSAQAPQSPFRAGVELVSLNVTVTDTSNRYVSDLEATDFSVFEDGVKQDVTFFTRKVEPVALSLLLDSSASMEEKLTTLQAAAVNFVRRLRPNDLAQVVDFDSRVEIRQGFTSKQSELEMAINQTTAGGRRSTTPSTSRSRS